MSNETKSTAEKATHYNVWLRQEHYTHYRIPNGVASSMSEAVQLVRDNDEKIHDHLSYDCFGSWGESIEKNANFRDEIFDTTIEEEAL